PRPRYHHRARADPRGAAQGGEVEGAAGRLVYLADKRKGAATPDAHSRASPSGHRARRCRVWEGESGVTHEWRKPDRRIGISLGWDGLTWWYAERMAMSLGNRLVWSDSGHVFGCGSFYR